MENAMMKDDQLEAVTGGVTIGDRMFTNPVGEKEAVVGEKYFIVEDNGRNWCYGTLTESYRQDVLCGNHCQRYTFDLSQQNGTRLDGLYGFKSTYVTLYRNCFTSAQGSF